MLLLRWLFPVDIPWSFYDPEDDPQEQFDEDWLSFYFEDDIVRTEYPDEDIKEEYDEDLIVFYFEDDQVPAVIIDDDERIDVEDDWYDAYGNIDPPPPPPDISEQIWSIFLDDDPREEYDDEVWDPYGQIDLPPIVCPLVPDDINAAIYYVTENGFTFYNAKDCAFYIAALLQETLSSGRQISEEEVAEEEFEFIRKVDYPEHLRFPDSSNIETVRYDKNTGEMQIKFKKGPTYKYEDVSTTKFKGLSKAKSAGSYFHNKIKPKHPGKKL